MTSNLVDVLENMGIVCPVNFIETFRINGEWIRITKRVEDMH